MLQRFITLLPFFFCLVFAFQYLHKRKKTDTQMYIFWTTVIGCVYFFVDAMYIMPVVPSYPLFLGIDMFARFVIPMFPLVGFLSIHSFDHPKYECRKFYWMYYISPIAGFVCITTVILTGFFDTAAFIQSLDLHHGITHEFDEPRFRTILYVYSIGFYTLTSLEVFVLMSYMVTVLVHRNFGLRSLWTFLFRGGEATPRVLVCWCTIGLVILCMVRVLVPRFVWMEHTNWAALVSILMAMLVFDMLYIGTIAHMCEGTLREMLHPLITEPAAAPDSDASLTIHDNLFSSEEQLANELIELMENKQLFRNPNLTIEDVAVRLNTTRNVVAHIIDDRMGVTFRDYTTKLRILHAKRYMILRPVESQRKVAEASGFPDAATFNKKFRQMEGLTPREWLLQQQQQHHHQMQKAQKSH